MPDFVVSTVEPELCMRLGQIVTKWTVVEKLISLLLGTCLIADQGAMSVVTNSIAVSTQTKWIRALMASHEHEATQNKRVSDLLTHADDLRQERNELIHGMWESDGCDPLTSIVETVNLDRNEIIRSRLVTSHDLDDLLRDINLWIDDYVALGRELGFPRQRGETKSMFAD